MPQIIPSLETNDTEELEHFHDNSVPDTRYKITQCVWYNRFVLVTRSASVPPLDHSPICIDYLEALRRQEQRPLYKALCSLMTASSTYSAFSHTTCLPEPSQLGDISCSFCLENPLSNFWCDKFLYPEPFNSCLSDIHHNDCVQI